MTLLADSSILLLGHVVAFRVNSIVGHVLSSQQHLVDARIEHFQDSFLVILS